MPGSRSRYYVLSCQVDYAAEVEMVKWFKECVWARYMVLFKTSESKHWFNCKLLFRMIDCITLFDFSHNVDSCPFIQSKTVKRLLKREFVDEIGHSKYRTYENSKYRGNIVFHQIYVPVEERLGPIAKDQSQWEEDQETDVDDPEDRPQPTEFEKGRRNKRRVVEKQHDADKTFNRRGTKVSTLVTEDGCIDEPDYHVRKQRRLEAEYLARMNQGENEIEIPIR